MATQEDRTAEAEAVALAFQVALTQIGAESLLEAIELWDDVNPTKIEATATRWLGRALQLIMSRRSQSKDLAVAYYRLVRALRTGKTIPDKAEPDRTRITLSTLRHQFAELVKEDAPAPMPQPDRSPHEEQGQEPEEIPIPEADYDPEDFDSDGDTEIEIEEIVDDLEELLEEVEDDAYEEARSRLAKKGPADLFKKLREIDTSKPADEVDEQREAAHAAVAFKLAADIERMTLNGARAPISTIARKDPSVIGYVRLSRTGTPCGWCAMLISRGLVFYKSEQSAGGDTDWHPNCHCYAEPIYSREYYLTDDRFALNREYAKLWPEVTKGYGGEEALSVWRKYIREQQAEAEDQLQAAA